MKLSELKPNQGAKKARKRVGRGPGSGHGKQSCKGHKGQNARSGGGVPIWFEGGQMPLHRRLPKRGFTNIFKKEYQIVNLDRLNIFESGAEISARQLVEKGIIKKEGNVKVLGNGELSNSITIKASKFSNTAKEKIEKAGGSIVVV